MGKHTTNISAENMPLDIPTKSIIWESILTKAQKEALKKLTDSHAIYVRNGFVSKNGKFTFKCFETLNFHNLVDCVNGKNRAHICITSKGKTVLKVIK